MATALGNITGMPKVPGIAPQAPGAAFDPLIKEATQKLEPVEQKIALGEKQELEERQRTAEQEAGIKAKQTRGIADIEAEKARKIAEAPGRKDVEELGKQEKDFLFQPGERDGLALATTASLMMVVGMALGKGGKFTAMNALSGMNGMMEGYRKRSDDLYKQEKQQFETNSKALRDKLNFAIQALERYERDVVRNADVAKMNLNADLSKEGLDFVKARGERAPILNQLPELRKMAAALNKQIGDLKSKQAAAEEKASQANRDLQSREYLTRLAASLRPTKETATGLKPSAKIQEGYVANNVLIQDLDNLSNKLKDPALVDELRKYRIEAFLTEEGKVLNQLIEQQIPSNLRKFLTEVRDIRNNYYLNMSGKAVTGGEALRNYGTVPQPGDAPEVMSDKIAGMKNRVEQVTGIQRQLYSLPDLSSMKLQGMKTPLNANETYPMAVDQAQAQPEVIKLD